MQSKISIFAGLLSKQIRRALPVYVACVIVFVVFLKIDHFEKFRHSSGDVLKHALSHPTNTRLKQSKLPRKIWQTWKTDPLEFEERDSTRARSWPSINPSYRYEVLTDGNDLIYVESHFGPNGLNRPDIVETYSTLTATIIKADLLRYLVMYVEGGVYADIDVEALREVNKWIPPHIPEDDVDLIIGVEIDEPSYLNHSILGPKSQSFCQWTFACKPRLPVMMRLIDHVLHWLNEIAQDQEQPISNITLNFNEVITGTGPSAFTGAILAEMAAQTGKKPPWDTFHALQKPVLVGNILVLTVEAFAAGQGHSNSGNHDSEKALVKHHYHASLWPSRHPRFSHPAFGMVEECNWEQECVANWTRGMAGYDALPYDEKITLIQAKEVVDKARFDKEVADKETHEREEADRREAELKQSCEAASYIPNPQTAVPTEVAGESQAPVVATEPAEAQEPKKGDGQESKSDDGPKSDIRSLEDALRW